MGGNKEAKRLDGNPLTLKAAKGSDPGGGRVYDTQMSPLGFCSLFAEFLSCFFLFFFLSFTVFSLLSSTE